MRWFSFFRKKSEFDIVCVWGITHPGTGEYIKFTGTFREVEYKYFEGTNTPCKFVNGEQEKYSKSYDRMRRFYKAKKETW